jgi:hypothetical protein
LFSIFDIFLNVRLDIFNKEELKLSFIPVFEKIGFNFIDGFITPSVHICNETL